MLLCTSFKILFQILAFLSETGRDMLRLNHRLVKLLSILANAQVSLFFSRDSGPDLDHLATAPFTSARNIARLLFSGHRGISIRAKICK